MESIEKFKKIYQEYSKIERRISYEIRESGIDYNKFDERRDYRKCMRIIKKFIKNCENKK